MSCETFVSQWVNLYTSVGPTDPGMFACLRLQCACVECTKSTGMQHSKVFDGHTDLSEAVQNR